MKRKWLPLPAVRAVLVALAAMVMGGCERLPDLAGGTDTETKLVGIIRQEGGQGAADVQVTVLRRGHNPLPMAEESEIASGRTDAQGRFAIAGVPQETYNLEARDKDGRGVALIQDVEVRADFERPDLPVIVPDGTLLPPGEIVIPWERLPSEARWVYLDGTTVFRKVERESPDPVGLRLRSVPSASYSVLSTAGTGGVRGENLLQEILEVKPANTTVLPPYATWRHMFRLGLNTTAAGAGIGGTVSAFPLLVQLDSGNFDFSRAQYNGADIRFAKPDGTPLPFKIETWDDVARRAELWVRMDTVYGNRESQYILMFAGRDEALTLSSGAAVFAPASASAGVWHLTQETPGRGNLKSILDGSGNAFHGDDHIGNPDREGIVGFGHRFDGAEDYIDLPPSRVFLTRPGQPLSLSAWVNPDSAGPWGPMDAGARILDIRSADSARSAVVIGLGPERRPFFAVSETTVVYAREGIPARQWRHLCLTYDGKSFRIYVDGALQVGPIAIDLPAGGEARARIGASAAGPRMAFPGLLDEVRISRLAYPDPWVKLSFENQRQGQSLIRPLP